VNVLVFGGTGMIGQGALRECLRDMSVERVLTVGRHQTGLRHDKLAELVTADVADLSAHAGRLSGFDACLFCLGVSAVGMSEDAYARVTYDLTLAVARTLLAVNPGLTFIYVSGQGTDSTERGRSMWARVKGRTENVLLALSERTYMFRPGAIIPLDGIRSRTPLYNAFYAVARPLNPLLRRLFPASVMTTEQLGRAMLVVARSGASQRVLEPRDIIALAR
jgi:uncharacterized protein YbjT (DUF2867 family)